MRKFVLVLTALLLCVAPSMAWGMNIDVSYTGGDINTDPNWSYSNATKIFTVMGDVTIIGTTVVSGSPPILNGNRIVVADNATANITLKDATIEVSGNPAIDIGTSTTGATVTLTLAAGSTNRLESDSTNAILGRSPSTTLTIDGTGALVAEGGSTNHGIGSGMAITINGGTVTAKGGSGISTGTGYITINGGTVTAEGATTGVAYGINAGKGLTIKGGTVTATGAINGIYAGNDITISGGTVTGTGTGATGIGIFSATIILISDTTTVKATGEVYGIFANTSITVSGGVVTATATATTGVGISASGGSMTINGGTVTAVGGTRAFNVWTDGTGPVTVSIPEYTYWTNTFSSAPGGDGTTVPGGAAFDNSGIIYKYVKIAPNYALTVTAGTGGKITTETSGSYAAGSAIDIAAAPNTGYTFSGWTSTPAGVNFADATSAATTFTMPANDVTITANFELGGGNLNNRGGNNNNGGGGGNNNGGGDGGKKGGGGGCDAMAANAGVGMLGVLALTWGLLGRKK